jgi:hypothetical protein
MWNIRCTVGNSNLTLPPLLITAHLLVSARQLVLHADEPPAAVLLELDELLPGRESEAEGAAVGGPGGSARCSPRLKVPLVFSGKNKHKVQTEPVFLHVYGAPELIPRNDFRQPM